MGLLRLENLISNLGRVDASMMSQAHCYIYAERGEQLSTLFADAGLSVMRANPLIADDTGVFDICHLLDGYYRVVITSSSGEVLLEEETFQVRSTTSMVGGMIFEAVSEVLEDIRMSYSVKKGGILIAKGDFLQVCSGGHFYEVLSSGDQNPDIVTPGGVKLRVTAEAGVLDVRAFGAVGDGMADDTAAIQAALDTASNSGGGAVLLPVGTWRTTETLMIRRSVSLRGRSHAGGQRGGGTSNHPVTIQYEGNGVAIQLGEADNPCVNAHVEGFAIVAEPTAENYRSFTAFYAYDLRSSQMQNLYVEGADKGFLFTGAGGAVVYVATQNINTHMCVTGLEVDCPTSPNEVWPFIQGNTFGIREISDCDVGIRLGGGQQNHNRIVVTAGEIGNCGIGIHVDADEGGNRLVYQLEGQGWFENNPGGNIVMDAGTLYLSGDITNSDNNVFGGYILNGGRLLPLGRLSFDDYSIPFTGFTSNGLVRAWSFVDTGDNTFHCPLSGASAQIVGTGGAKTRSNTRFGDGVQGSGAGGGLRVMDQSFDWTGDWTLAMLVYTPTTADSEIFKVQKNTPLSKLEIDARPGFIRILTQEEGGEVVITDLGKSNDNPTRCAFWVIVSYDSTLEQIQFRAPSGAVLDTWNQRVPPALAHDVYDNWSLNGSLCRTQAVIDEVMVYNRVLTPDEVSGIVELRANVANTLGMDPRQGMSRSGQHDGTTNETGTVNIQHGLLSAPNAAFAQLLGVGSDTAHVLSITGSQIAVEVRDSTGSPAVGRTVNLSWRAEL